MTGTEKSAPIRDVVSPDLLEPAMPRPYSATRGLARDATAGAIPFITPAKFTSSPLVCADPYVQICRSPVERMMRTNCTFHWLPPPLPRITLIGIFIVTT